MRRQRQDGGSAAAGRATAAWRLLGGGAGARLVAVLANASKRVIESGDLTLIQRIADTLTPTRVARARLLALGARAVDKDDVTTEPLPHRLLVSRSWNTLQRK